MTGYIYFVADEHERVKVGWTSRVDMRLRTLQTCNADKLVVLAVLRGDRDEERRILWKLKRDWVRGEWFRHTARLDRLLEELGAAPDAEAFIREGNEAAILLLAQAHGDRG